MLQSRSQSHWSIHAATMLVVDDLGESVTFYRDHLNFTVREQDSHIALLQAGTMLLYLFTESPPTPDKPSVTLANLNTADRSSVILVFRVADCHATYERLKGNGINFLTPPHMPSWGGWRCFTRDPNGYVIEIEQANG